MPDGRQIAFRKTGGMGPAIIFLPGYMSDMEGGKATAIYKWAQQTGRECLLLDYSGCGSSSGEFSGGTLSQWRDEVLALIAAQTAGPVVLVGSSMGGWLMLLIGLALGPETGPGRGHHLAGMIGIAAAPDFSNWGFTPDQKTQLAKGETIFEDNPAAPGPTPTYAKFWQDAETHHQLAADIALHCPVRLLHGQNDADVPWQTSLKLAERLCSDDIQVTLLKTADHRMSRDQDIELLLRTVAQMPSDQD